VFKRPLLSFCGWVVCALTYAQDITVHGRFVIDTTRVGNPLTYTLTAKSPSARVVLFPDSLYSYAPFEFIRKQYFTTVTKNNISVDSAVYWLRTFEIDSLQALALPVFVAQPSDCLTVYSSSDTVRLLPTVTSVPESVALKDLPLKSNADYLPVNLLLNYPLLFLGAGVLVIIAVLVWIFFGKRIRKYFQIRRLLKNHQAFLAQFQVMTEKWKAQATAPAAESALVLWKKYMEGLLARPFTKFTTPEILSMTDDDSLNNALHTIDRMVYAGNSDQTDGSFEALRRYSQNQFVRKTEDLRHG
jgi:hypothetical protein